MKILFLSHYSSFYGANQSLLSLILCLKRRGVQVLVIVPGEGDFTQELRSNSIEYHILKYYTLWTPKRDLWSWVIMMIKSLVNFWRVHKTKRFVDNINCDLIYSNSSVLGFGYDLAKATNRDHIWHFREFGDIDYGLSYLWGKKQLVKKTNRNFNKTIFISKALKGHYQNVRNGKVIYNGVISENDLDQSKLGLPSFPLNFSIIGLLHQAKNIIEAIRAFGLADLGDSILNIYGDSSDEAYKNKIKTLIKELDIEKNVILHGFVKDKDIAFRNTDCLIMASKNEGFGRVTAEAMSYCKIVIGYNGGGTKEIINDGVNGFLYDGSNDGLVSALNKVYSNYNNFIELRTQAREHVKNNYTVEKYAENILSFINDINLKKNSDG